jgi:hypothetical protein
MIGYGLTDVNWQGYDIADARINLLDWESEQAGKTFEGLLDYMDKSSLDAFLLGAMIKTDKSIRGDLKLRERSVIWNAEYGLGNVLCLVPPSCHSSWYRYDNIIDYAEETYIPGREQHDYVTVLDSAIYPFYEYWDTRNGQSVDTTAYCACRQIESYKPEADIMAQKLFNVSDYAEFRNVYAPKPPAEVLAMCKYLELMNVETTWQLRPMVYVYWG